MKLLSYLFTLLFFYSQPSYTLAIPVRWGFFFQSPASYPMERIIDFFNHLMLFMVVILGVTFWILVRCIILFHNNPFKINQRSEHKIMEISWTLIPVIILITISFPSFELLYGIEDLGDNIPNMTIKIVGHQWYWHYEYGDLNRQSSNSDVNFNFDQYMLPTDTVLTYSNEYRLLSTDTYVIFPVRKIIRLIITSADVIHAWAVPGLGVKMDALPGRLNQCHIIARYPGRYFGQCSEICGVNHGFMPIGVHIQPKSGFHIGGYQPINHYPRTRRQRIFNIAG